MGTSPRKGSQKGRWREGKRPRPLKIRHRLTVTVLSPEDKKNKASNANLSKNDIHCWPVAILLYTRAHEWAGDRPQEAIKRQGWSLIMSGWNMKGVTLCLMGVFFKQLDVNQYVCLEEERELCWRPMVFLVCGALYNSHCPQQTAAILQGLGRSFLSSLIGSGIRCTAPPFSLQSTFRAIVWKCLLHV